MFKMATYRYTDMSPDQMCGSGVSNILFHQIQSDEDAHPPAPTDAAGFHRVPRRRAFGYY